MVSADIGSDELVALASTEDQRNFAQEAVDFLAGSAPRRAADELRWGVGDERLTLFHETTADEERAEATAALQWQRARWEAGFGWITGPVEYGGRGLTADYEALYRRIEAAFDIPDMSPLRIGIGTVGPAILSHGSADQIKQHAVAIYRGDTVACQLFSEPAAGSDLAGVQTRAVQVSGGWELTGQKVWTSNATFADLGLALVRTDPSAAKHRGLTMFLVPMSAKGVDVRRLRQMTGGASFCEVFLDQVTIADAGVLGELSGGWSVAVGALAGERKAVGDRTHAITDHALGLLRELAQHRGALSDPLIRQQWSRVYSTLRVARAHQERVQTLPESELSGAERAIDKLMVSANLRALGELAAAILGQELVVNTHEWGTFAWNKWIMGALGYRIAGGTEEILKTMLAERVLKLPKEGR